MGSIRTGRVFSCYSGGVRGIRHIYIHIQRFAPEGRDSADRSLYLALYARTRCRIATEVVYDPSNLASKRVDGVSLDSIYMLAPLVEMLDLQPCYM